MFKGDLRTSRFNLMSVYLKITGSMKEARSHEHDRHSRKLTAQYVLNCRGTLTETRKIAEMELMLPTARQA